METASDLLAVQTVFSSITQQVSQPEDNRLDIYIPAEKIAYAVGVLTSTGKWRLSAITAMDIPQTQDEDGKIEILYHYCRKTFVVTLRIQVPYGSPIVPSICRVIPSAVLYEREAAEMFGVIFEGIPMRDKLLLPDDWPDGFTLYENPSKGLNKRSVPWNLLKKTLNLSFRLVHSTRR